MAWEEVVSGNVFQLANLPSYEGQLAEGSYNCLELMLAVPCTSGVAQTMQDYLVNQGVENVSVRPFTGSQGVRIYWTKNPWWIPVILVAIAIVALLILSWILFTQVPGLPQAIPWIALSVVAVATVAGIYLVRRNK